MFTDKDETDSGSSEEQTPASSSGTSGSNLRQMIENGLKDWNAFKGLHGTFKLRV